MTALRDFLGRHRTAGVLVTCVALIVLALVVATRTAGRASSDAPSSRPTSVKAGSGVHPSTPDQREPVSAQRLSSADQGALKTTIAGLRTMPGVTPATSRVHRAIRGQAGQQPDLYAATFTRALLTQNYRTPRADLLAWVQSESALSTEPTVVGLIPAELRPKLAVASVQEGFDGPGPVPAPGVWSTLATRHGHASVVIQRVIEPVAWSVAVANGTITDPGVTAREVDAAVTLHILDRGRSRNQKYSVAVTMNLEGPPVRDTYGLVMVVGYKSVRVG